MVKLKGSFPVFTVEDIEIAKSYYTSHFDFDVAFSNEWYLHLISKEGIQIGFLLPNQSTQPDIFKKPYNGEGVIFSLEVDDVDSAYAIAKSSSLNIVLELRSEDWGQKHFCVKDPNGVYLDILQSTDPTEEYQDGYNSK